MSERIQENKMGTLPVNKLLVSMALPMIISMLIQALYNVVDSIFVAQLSENALAAVGMAFPFQNLMIAVATGTGTGVNALLSRSLGERKQDVANKAAENGVFLAFLSYVFFLLAGIFASRFYFTVQTDIAEIVEAGVAYITICSIFSFGVFTTIIFERLLQATGRTLYTMITQASGSIVNIILDPLLIFGIGPFPELGVAGAAVATVIGQCVAGALAVTFHIRYNHDLQTSIRGFRPQASIIRQIYSVGVPSIVMSSIGSVMTFGMNMILISFSATATAVFSIYYKLQSFVFMPIFGLNLSVVPIVAYNYGAKAIDRMVRTIVLAMAYATGIMLLGLLIVQCFTTPILLLFNASEDMLAIGIPALRIISICFLFAGVCIVGATVYQALGHGFFSMFLSFTRQLIVLLPTAWLLSQTGNINLVWLAFPIAELASLAISIFFLRKLYVKIVVPYKVALKETESTIM